MGKLKAAYSEKEKCYWRDLRTANIQEKLLEKLITIIIKNIYKRINKKIILPLFCCFHLINV